MDFLHLTHHSCKYKSNISVFMCSDRPNQTMTKSIDQSIDLLVNQSINQLNQSTDQIKLIWWPTRWHKLLWLLSCTTFKFTSVKKVQWWQEWMLRTGRLVSSKSDTVYACRSLWDHQRKCWEESDQVCWCRREGVCRHLRTLVLLSRRQWWLRCGWIHFNTFWTLRRGVCHITKVVKRLHDGCRSSDSMIWST